MNFELQICKDCIHLIAKIAEARINELSEKFCLKNINLTKPIKENYIIFLEIYDQQHFNCFNHAYKNSFTHNSTCDVRIVKKPEIEKIVDKADNIVQFGWKREAIPVTKSKKSFIARFFEKIFS